MILLLKRLITFKTKGVRFMSGFLVFCFLTQTAAAENNIWFSNKPPAGDKRSAPSGMHGLSSIKGKRGMLSVIQWLRQGTHPKRAITMDI